MNELLDQLKTILSTAFSTTFTTYYKGKIEIPSQSGMPILMVYPVRTEQRHDGTLRDQVDYYIAIEAVYSLKSFLDNTNATNDESDALKQLMKIVEERESDGDLKTTTIMGILNANLSIGSRVLYTDDMQVDYIPYFEASQFPACKATVTFRASDRPNRT